MEATCDNPQLTDNRCQAAIVGPVTTPAPTPRTSTPPSIAHEQPLLSAAAPSTTAQRPGAPRGNQNATRTATKAEKIGHVGSSLADELATAEGHVNRDMGRVMRELAAAHPDWVEPDGGLRLPAAVDAILMALRRAYERDRVAATLLYRLKDLKGNPLNHDQQVKQREIQEAALKTVESCLKKLGLDQHDAKPDPWREVSTRLMTLPAKPLPPAPQQEPA